MGRFVVAYRPKAGCAQRAHPNPAVGALWSEFASVCDYVPLATVPEAQQTFAEFDAIAT